MTGEALLQTIADRALATFWDRSRKSTWPHVDVTEEEMRQMKRLRVEGMTVHEYIHRNRTIPFELRIKA